MDPRLRAATDLAPEHWAALHGVAIVADHLRRALGEEPAAAEHLRALIEMLNEPASLAEAIARADWNHDANPPREPASAAADLPGYTSLPLWAARYLRLTAQDALAPLVQTVPAEWIARAVAVISKPVLLDHARRTLLSSAEQVAVADEFLPDPRRLAPEHYERYARDMRAGAASPEEWVARFGHTLWFGSMFEFRYADPETDRWLARVIALHTARGATDLLRQQVLRPDEWSAIEVLVHSEDYEP